MVERQTEMICAVKRGLAAVTERLILRLREVSHSTPVGLATIAAVEAKLVPFESIILASASSRCVGGATADTKELSFEVLKAFSFRTK